MNTEMNAIIRPRRPERGVSSVLVLAILVTLGSLAVHATGLVTGALGDDSRAIAQARAAAAAEAGLEWGRHRVLVPATPVCTPALTLNALPGTLQGYAVTVRCTAGPLLTDGGAPLRRYQLVATACNLPAAGACPNAATAAGDYVQRTVQVVLHR
ncbi:MAG: agglutinin biogenesis protein MshP [Burkholderiales bacterium]|nr:agglutinin biogenesis protein MshP [Burkholderiales bacterium]